MYIGTKHININKNAPVRSICTTRAEISQDGIDVFQRMELELNKQYTRKNRPQR